MTVLIWNSHWPEGISPGVRYHLFYVLWAKGGNECLLSGTDASSSCSSAHRSPALSAASPLHLFSLSKLLTAEVKCISVEHRALPASQLGSLSKRDVCQVQYHCVCRHHRSLPSPEVGCQCKCHVNMTFTSLESGKGLATDTFSYLVSSISNWASWIFRLKNSIRKWYLMYLNLSLPSSKKGEIHRLQDKP